MVRAVSVRTKVEMKAEFLITGASGQLGRALLRLLGNRAAGTDLPGLDVTSADSVRTAVDAWDPLWIVNCAAVTDVDRCEREPELAMKVHRDGVANLASAGRRLLTISTDHVFTGKKGRTRPFLEDDRALPANQYGRSKLMGELEALRSGPGNIVVRTSWMFSDREGLVPFIWRSLSRRGEVMAVSDQQACLTYAPDLAAAMVALMERDRSGVFHLVNRPGMTPARVADLAVRETGGEVRRVEWSDLDLDAPRPFYSELGTSRGVELPAIRDALKRWKERNV